MFVVNQDDILTTDSQIIEGLSHVEDRLKEFEELMAETGTDHKYLSYNDQAIYEFDKEQYVESLMFESEMAKRPRDKLYSTNFVKTIESYMEDKYAELEHQRVAAEDNFSKLVELDFQAQLTG